MLTVIKTVIKTIVIENLIRKVKLSNCRRTHYYNEGDKIPSRYLLKAKDRISEDIFSGTYSFRKPYEWRKRKQGKRIFNSLYNTEGQYFVIKNAKTAGTERWTMISGQLIYNAGYNPFVRNKVIGELHKFFTEKLQNSQLLESTLSGQGITEDKFPLYMEYLFEIDIDEEKADLDNLALPYVKAFQDTLTETKIIPNDSLKYIKGSKVIFQTPKLGENKLTIKFYANTST